jgi:hypothetical protein
VQASQRTVFSAPSLVRLLARVSAADVSESGPSPFDRLSEWLRWTDAIALSNILDAALPASGMTSRVPGAGDAEARLCADARTALARAIADDSGLVLSRQQARPSSRSAGGRPSAMATDRSASPQSAPDPGDDDKLDYSVVRQHYLSLQQMMEARIADLRDQLRQRLAACSVQLARLAAIDETMERALGEREHALLSTVPILLETHFKRLQEAEQHAPDGASDVADNTKPAPRAWLGVFRKDMQSALHAELAIRFQPVEALLVAFRTR